MLTPARERLKLHLRAEIDGAQAIEWIRYLTGALATGYENPVHGGDVLTPLDDLRTRQIALALTNYQRTLTRVLPDLKPMDLMEALAPGTEGRDWSAMDRLELANRMRHILVAAAPKQVKHDDDWWD